MMEIIELLKEVISILEVICSILYKIYWILNYLRIIEIILKRWNIF